MSNPGPATNRVHVAPALLQWAQLRSGRDVFELAEKFPKLAAWESGQAQPTFRQLEAFARATHVPVGMLFLDEPPDERLPLSDFRTIAGQRKRPSGDLLDTIYLCQQRQAWLAEELTSLREAPSPMVSRASAGELPEAAAARARVVLGFGVDDRPALPPERAFAALSACAESAGVLVMVSGVVGNNNTRPLNVDEFRGFALLDPLAPLVFVNGVDAKAAQVFTLAHELGHLWRGESAVSASDLRETSPALDAERWCDAFAAELLVPEVSLRQLAATEPRVREEPRIVARRFAVSEAVAVRRLYDLGMMPEASFRERLRVLLMRRAANEKSGGDFYATLLSRVSRRFARGVVSGALEGRIPFNRALRLLGFQKLAAFDELARQLGVIA